MRTIKEIWQSRNPVDDGSEHYWPTVEKCFQEYTSQFQTDGWTEIEKWSGQYEFSFQFWGAGNNNVFINKGGVELASFGGENSIEDILRLTLKWVNEKNPSGYKEVKKIYRCGNCGAPIAKGNDFCGECLCEDDSF